VPDEKQLAADGVHIQPYISGGYSGRRQKIHSRTVDFEKGTACQSEQPEPVERHYDDHCVSHQSDGRSEQFNENAQVDLLELCSNYKYYNIMKYKRSPR
jgi:hypothetical protein